MKRRTKPVENASPREPLPPPAANSDIRPWIHIGEAGEIALSGIEHSMRQAHAELGAEVLWARDKLRTAHEALSEVLNVIELWADRPSGR